MPLPAGTLLHSRYRIVSILGQGGMGAVYRANDEHLNIPVAVKENLFLTDEYTRQFQREARILASMRHPGLPHVQDYFVIEGQGQYLVMDYIEGEDLRQRMERTGPLPERDAILIGISVLDALYHLHNRTPPVIHRDIKPGNIKVTPQGSAVLVDFGLAKFLQPGQATQTGARAMTPGYSPPEQYGTSRTDARSDIYSLGATLYAAITGTIPEDGLNRMAGKAELTSIHKLRPKVNRRLVEIIEEAMEIEPDDRYQSAEDFRKALIECGEMAAYFRERPTLTPPPSEIPPVSSEAPQIGQDSQPPSNNKFLFGRNTGRNRRARQSALRLAAGLIVILLAALFTLATVIRPDFPGTLLAYIQGNSAPNPTSLAPIASPTNGGSNPNSSATQEPTVTAANVAETKLTPTLSSTPTETSFPTPIPTQIGGSGEIAYASQRTGILQIWVVNSGNKQMRQITNLPDGACQPSWSPDGLKLVFISPCSTKKDIYEGVGMYTINADGTGLTQLPSSPEGDFSPAWSPSGKIIAFSSLRTGRPSIFLLNLDTMGVTEISQSRYADFQPAWSSKSRQLAFVRKVVYEQIWIMSEDGSQQKIFSPVGEVNNINPTWSQDGNIIFYSQSPNDFASPPTLVGMRYEDRSLSREFRIPAGSTTDIGPIAGVNVSPDGFWLAYEGWPGGTNHDIFMMTANGANVTRLTSDPGLDFGPVWRPILTTR
jgi:eukaryotic-like serine/threonine-protein kinase